jgi:hypothetical protein
MMLDRSSRHSGREYAVGVLIKAQGSRRSRVPWVSIGPSFSTAKRFLSLCWERKAK